MAGTTILVSGTETPWAELKVSQSWATPSTSSYRVATQNPPCWSLWATGWFARMTASVSCSSRARSGDWWSKWWAHHSSVIGLLPIGPSVLGSDVEDVTIVPLALPAGTPPAEASQTRRVSDHSIVFPCRASPNVERGSGRRAGAGVAGGLEHGRCRPGHGTLRPGRGLHLAVRLAADRRSDAHHHRGPRGAARLCGRRPWPAPRTSATRSTPPTWAPTASCSSTRVAVRAAPSRSASDSMRVDDTGQVVEWRCHYSPDASP